MKEASAVKGQGHFQTGLPPDTSHLLSKQNANKIAKRLDVICNGVLETVYMQRYMYIYIFIYIESTIQLQAVLTQSVLCREPGHKVMQP